MRAEHAAAALAVALAIAGAAVARSPSSASPFHPLPKSPGLLLRDADHAPPAPFVTYPDLDRVATIFAMRPYSIHCPTPEGWELDPLSEIAWGYTALEWDYAVLDPILCEAALDLGIEESSDDWVRALAAQVFAHETLHGRLWSHRANEAKVQCHAVRHSTVAMRLLGAREEEVQRLKPYALLFHWRLGRLVDEYFDPSCVVPSYW